MLHIYKFEAKAKRSRPLIAWSGTFVASIVKSIMSREEIECGFSVTPLQIVEQDGQKVVLSGIGMRSRPGEISVQSFSNTVIESGSRLVFRVASFCREAPLSLLNVSDRDDLALSIQSIEYELVNEFSSSKVEDYVQFIDVHSRGLVEVFFYPTILVFQGWRVLYPSPQRLVFGLARSAVELLNLDPRVVRRRARVLSRSVELVGDYTRVVDVYIGRGRVVKAFMGRALFGVKGLENLRDFVDILKFGAIVGVGKSRGIGFGFYRYRVVSSDKK